MQIGILEPKDFSIKVIEKLKTFSEVGLYNDENLEEFLLNKNILFIRLNYFIGSKFLDSCPQLKFICTPTTGLNHIDIKEVKKRNIQIISLKNEFTFLNTIRATPEHTFGLVLSLLRNYKEAFLNSKNCGWDRDLYKGNELYGKNIGIIGFGRVGSILAKYFVAFDCKIRHYDSDTSKDSNISVKMNSLFDLILSSDIVVLCASYSEEYNSFFDKSYIDLLEDKYFINTSRGELIDENYLINKISNGFFSGVALDVINNETFKNNNLEKLLKLTEKNNLIITPHIAGATYESMWKTEEFIFSKLKESICN